MGSFSLMHWIVVLAIVVLLFGAGKIPRLMGDFAKGIKAFKAGMKEDDDTATATAETPAQVAPPKPAQGQTTVGAHTAERV